jgi:hypothetical protein
VLICDDYNFWMGHRKAIDEYFSELGESLLMCRIDSSAVMAVVSEAVVVKAKKHSASHCETSFRAPVEEPNT